MRFQERLNAAEEFADRHVTALQALFLCISAVYIFLHEYVLPLQPILRDGDHLLFLHEAERMLHGEVLYHDFFEFATPGTPATYWLLFRVFGPTALTENTSVVALGFGSLVLMLYISRVVLPGWRALIPPLMYLTLVLHHGLSANHHVFSAFWAMAAVACVIRHRTTMRFVAAGVCCGLSSFYTETRGAFVLIGLLVFVAWERWELREGQDTLLIRGLGLVVSSAITVVCLLSYFVIKAGLHAFLYSIIIFPWNFYPAYHHYNNLQGFMADLPPLSPWWRIPTFVTWIFLHVATPAAYVLCLYRCGKNTEGTDPGTRARLLLLAAVGFALFVEIAQAPGWPRVLAVCFPSLVILVWMLRARTPAGFATLSGLILLSLGFLIPGTWMAQRANVGSLHLPIGDVVFLNHAWFEKMQWLSTHTRPFDFFYGDSYCYFPLRLRNPAGVPFLTSTAYTRPEQAADVLRCLQRRNVRLFAIHSMEEMSAASPGNALGPLISYVRVDYDLVKTLEDGGGDLLEIYELRPSVNEARTLTRR